MDIINRSGVAGAVPQSTSSLIHRFINSLIESSFRSESSRHCQSVRARELTFYLKIWPQPCATFHVSHVTCHVSGFQCHFFYKVVVLVVYKVITCSTLFFETEKYSSNSFKDCDVKIYLLNNLIAEELNNMVFIQPRDWETFDSF